LGAAASVHRRAGCTQNVLWRFDHGELNAIHPKWAIGTNNFTKTDNARDNTPEEIAESVKQILLRIRAKTPDAKIILMEIFPHGEDSKNSLRAKGAELNKLLSKFGGTKCITFLDISSKLTQSDGSITREIMSDFLHSSEAGYKIRGRRRDGSDPSEVISAPLETPCHAMQTLRKRGRLNPLKPCSRNSATSFSRATCST